MRAFVIGLGLLAVLPVTGCGATGAAVLGALVARGEAFVDNRAVERNRCEDEDAALRQAMTAMILDCAKDKRCSQTEIDRRIAIVNKAVEIQDQCLDDVPFGRLIGGKE